MSVRSSTAQAAAFAVSGSPEYLGTIVATTAGVNQVTTGTAFTVPQGAGILLQGDADFFLSTSQNSNDTPPELAASLGLPAQTPARVVTRDERNIVWLRTESGTANVKVFHVR